MDLVRLPIPVDVVFSKIDLHKSLNGAPRENPPGSRYLKLYVYIGKSIFAYLLPISVHKSLKLHANRISGLPDMYGIEHTGIP